MDASAMKIPEHPLIVRDDPTMITTQVDLDALIERLRVAGLFAYDTEFIGEMSYHPRLCLIQVATVNELALIDPLEGLDIDAFWALLADPDIVKIVHAGQQDLEPVVRLLDREPANVFDTQIFAAFANLSYPMSLLRMVRELLDVTLGKALTFTHWDARPLSPVHQRYAADDVRYLIAVREALLQRFDHDDHGRWAREECEALCARELYEFDPATRWQRVRGGRNMKPRQIAILRELVGVRDAAAREHDVPPRTMIRDEVLIAISKNPVKNLDQLAQIRGLPRPVEHAYGAQLVSAVARGKAIPAAELPAPQDPEESSSEKHQINSLWALIMAFCHGRAIDPSIVGTRQDFARCYRTLLGQRPETKCRLLEGWRGDLLRDVLTSLLSGETQVSVRWNGERMLSSIEALKSDSAPS